MISFSVFYEQIEQVQPQEEHTFAIFTTGRMNPPTKGHLRLVANLMEAANQHNADAYLFPLNVSDGMGSTYKSRGNQLIRTHVIPNRVKNPLRPDIKLQFVKQLLGVPGLIVDLETNCLSALSKLKELGYTDVVYVTGSDYFDGVSGDDLFSKELLPDRAESLGLGFAVVDGGDRVTGLPGVSGYKSSLAREAAINGDLGEFRSRTGWSGEVARRLFKEVRKGMGLIND